MPGSRQLFVLRHAKSSWEDPGLADHDRPLAPRGRQAVKLLAEHLREEGIRPDRVLCSSSRRTVDTLAGLGIEGERSIERDLYGADATEVLERLQRLPDEVESAMVIGHNPTMQVLVLRLTGGAGEVERKFPTGALATLQFECVWSELAPGCAELLKFVRPKALHRDG